MSPKYSVVLPLALTTLLLSACAHHRDVRPGANGVNAVVVRGQTREAAERGAINQAQHYCGETQRQLGIVEEKTEYTGTMDEGTRDTVNKASTAAMILGGGTINIGGNGTHSNNSNTLGKAGTVGHVMTSGDDYVTSMKFRCQ